MDYDTHNHGLLISKDNQIHCEYRMPSPFIDASLFQIHNKCDFTAKEGLMNTFENNVNLFWKNTDGGIRLKNQADVLMSLQHPDLVAANAHNKLFLEDRPIQ